MTMVHPIFDEDGNIFVFPAVRAHWVDVGGMVPGSYSGLSTNIYQEGVRIPPIKILERGKVNRAAMALRATPSPPTGASSTTPAIRRSRARWSGCSLRWRGSRGHPGRGAG